MKSSLLLFIIIICATNLNAQNILLDETVDVKVCFTANHTYVSDLGFYLVAPGQTSTNPGNYGILQLLPAASDWGEEAAFDSWTGIPWDVLGCSDPEDMNTVCNSGNNLENFCFTSTLEAGNPDLTACICDTDTPLTGDFASVESWEYVYGFPLIGNWGLSIFDCESVDYGELVEGSISFETNCGRTIVYSLIPEAPIPINDGSCNLETASLVVYSPDLYCTLSITINNETSLDAVNFLSNSDFTNDNVPFEPFLTFDSIYISNITKTSETQYLATYNIVQEYNSKSGIINAVYDLGEELPDFINLVFNIEWNNTETGATQIINVNHEISSNSSYFTDIKNNQSEEIKLYPNPVKNTITLDLANKYISSKYCITSSDGKIIDQGVITGTKQVIATNNYASGSYFIILTIENSTNNEQKKIPFIVE